MTQKNADTDTYQHHFGCYSIVAQQSLERPARDTTLVGKKRGKIL